MKRFALFVSLFALLLAGCGQEPASEVAEAPAAEQAPFVISINQIVEHPSLDAMQQGFKDRLADLGVDAEYNVHIAQGNMQTNLQIASQIMGENPDLVLAITTPSAQVVAQKVVGPPIVFTGVTDPVSAGLVPNLEHPGGSITGMTDMSPMDRHLELILEFMPDLKQLGVLYNAGEPNSVVLIDWLRDEAARYGIEIVDATAANSGAVYQAAQSLVGRCQAMYVPVDNTVVSALESAIKVAEDNQLPFFSADTDSVERGTVAALAVDYYDMGVQTADMARRILVDGADPGDMPVESIQRLRLYVNPGAAERMGVAIPQAVLDRADMVVQ